MFGASDAAKFIERSAIVIPSLLEEEIDSRCFSPLAVHSFFSRCSAEIGSWAAFAS